MSMILSQNFSVAERRRVSSVINKGRPALLNAGYGIEMLES